MKTIITAIRAGEPHTNATITVIHKKGLDVLDAIDRCFSAWYQTTPEGRDAWEYTCGDYNIGDFLSLKKPSKEFQEQFGFYIEEYDCDDSIEITYDRIWGNGDCDLEEEEKEEDAPVETRDWSNAEMVEVTVYRSSTGLYTEEECDDDPLCFPSFPKEIVIAYYEEHRSLFENEQIQRLHIPIEDCSFEKWFDSVYTANDTRDLCEFAEERGFNLTTN